MVLSFPDLAQSVLSAPRCLIIILKIHLTCKLVLLSTLKLASLLDFILFFWNTWIDIGGSDGTGSNGGNGGRDSSVKRIWPWTTCTKDRIHINQGPTPPLPSGIPTYTVIIENACYFGNCTISNVHLSCGWFSSARHINPSVFKRIRYDDCLVNNGEPLTAGQALTFQYANTFSYPLRVSSVSC